MRSKFNYYVLLALIPLAFLLWYFASSSKERPLRHLPYFGPKNSKSLGDTSYHQVPAFSFTSQYGETVNEQTVKDHIYVTEFFFTNCRSICPIMNSHLDKIYQEFKNQKDFLILSHTVDPENDSIQKLKEFAELHGVKDRRWLFLTGDKKQLYGLARKGYLLSADEGDGGAEDFVHTQNFALVDKSRHI